MIRIEDITISEVVVRHTYIGVETAMVITHISTGIQVTCGSERSRHANVAKALEELDQKVMELEASKPKWEWRDSYTFEGEESKGKEETITLSSTDTALYLQAYKNELIEKIALKLESWETYGFPLPIAVAQYVRRMKDIL